MSHPDFILLYVDHVQTSARFYSRLFDCLPVESSDNFALFILKSGLKLGLWTRQAVEPTAQLTGGGGELVIQEADNAAVDACHTHWQRLGLTILQAPVQMDFGYTFVALDPDNHRLRVYCPGVV